MHGDRLAGGPYFAEGIKGIDIWVADEWARRVAARARPVRWQLRRLVDRQYEGYEGATRRSCSSRRPARTASRSWGGMNVFFVTRRWPAGYPPADRDDPRRGHARLDPHRRRRTGPDPPVERGITPSDLVAGLESGDRRGVCCGTAAVISRISAFRSKAFELAPADQSFAQTLAIRDAPAGHPSTAASRTATAGCAGSSSEGQSAPPDPIGRPRGNLLVGLVAGIVTLSVVVALAWVVVSGGRGVRRPPRPESGLRLLRETRSAEHRHGDRPRRTLDTGGASRPPTRRRRT